MVTTDFGLARVARSGGSLTTVGMLIGTPEYWSPEQALGRETETASDLYALGCILFLLVGAGSRSKAMTGSPSGSVAPTSKRRRLTTPAPDVRPWPPTSSIRSCQGIRRAARCGSDGSVVVGAGGRTGRPARSVKREHEAPTAVTFGRQTAALRMPGRRSRRRLRRAEASTSRRHRPRRRLHRSAGSGSLPESRRRHARARRHGRGRAARRRRRPWLHEGPVRKVPESSRSVQQQHVLRSSRRCRCDVSVRWVYSTRVSLGRVISQRPAARTSVGRGADVTLTVSKGTPFAEVPAVPVGASAPAARQTLARTGSAHASATRRHGRSGRAR